MNKGRIVVMLALGLFFFLHPVLVSAQPVQELSLGVAVNGSLSGTGDEQYYKVNVASGQHLFVVLDADDNLDYYDLYIKFGSLPTTIDYDDRGDSARSDQAVEIASTQAGDYYIMVHSTSGGGAYSIVAHTNSTFPTLTLGTSKASSLQGTYDVKYYQISVTAGEHLFVDLDADDNLDYYDLYIKFGSLPNTTDYDDRGDSPRSDQAVEIASTQAGTYYIMVCSTSGGGAYSIVAHTNSTFPTLTPGTSKAGSLQGTYDVKYYQVSVTAGEHLFVVLDADDNLDYYDLYIKFGSLPTTTDYDDRGDSPRSDQAVEIASTQAGTYYLMVRSTSGGGAYSIVAHTNSTFPTLTLGTSKAGSLQGTYDVKYYQLSVIAGERLFVILDADDNLDYYDLYIKFGSLPTTTDYDDRGGSARSDQAVEIASTQAGTYYLMVRSTSSGGNYTIVAHTNSTFPTLTLGTSKASSLQGTYDVKYYQISVTAGEHLFVVLDADDNLDYYDLYIKFGSLPTTTDYDDRGDSPRSDQAVEIASTRAGTYYIMVRSTSSGGNYIIVAHTNSTFPTLTPGTSKAGSLQGTYDVKYYQVSVTAGEHLFVVLDADDDSDSYDLYIKFGSLPTTVDYDGKGDSPNADQAVEIASTQAGTYYIMVRSTYSGGNYTIRAQSICCRIFLPIVARNYNPLLPYFDDFSDPNSGWYTDDSGNIKRSYQGGEYEMLIRSEYWWAGATAPVGGVTHCSVEADMRCHSGGTNLYGLIFSLVDWDRLYFFMVDPDSRYYSVFRHDPTTWVPIVDWTYSSYINPSNATNHLKVERSGGQITVYTNGHLLTTANDDTYTGILWVGLYAESGDDVPVAVRYDNFQVKQLGTRTFAHETFALREVEISTGGGGLVPPLMRRKSAPAHSAPTLVPRVGFSPHAPAGVLPPPVPPGPNPAPKGGDSPCREDSWTKAT